MGLILRLGKVRNNHRIVVGKNPNGRDCLVELGVDGNLIVNCILTFKNRASYI
jgi:hypothetical protein